MKISRKAVAISVLVLFALASLVGIANADCMSCWTKGVEVGMCLIILDDDFFPGFAYANCLGIKECFRYPGGETCYPACIGGQCYWV